MKFSLSLFQKSKVVDSTAFSDFFRNASSREKNKVYGEVLKRATQRQQKLLDRVKQAGPDNKELKGNK